MYFEDLFPEFGPESKNIELKGTLEEGPNPSSKDNPLARLEYGWLKAVNAFANTEGGTLFVGIENKTHKIISLSHEDVDRLSLRFHRLVKDHIHPEIEYDITPIKVSQEPPFRYILKIDIERSASLPVTLHIDGYNFIFIRYFGKNSPATPEQIRNLSLDGKEVSFDSRFTDEIYNSSSFSLLQETYKERNNGSEIKDKQLIDAGFMDKDGHLSVGALLFKDDCDDERTLLIAMKIKGTNKGTDFFYRSKEIKGNLIKVIEEATSFVKDNSANGFQKSSDGSIPYESFPKRSLVEAIANAVCHRNYYLSGTQIELNLYDDRLELISPGSYPIGTNIDKTTEIANIMPGRRNEVICAVLSLLGYVDKKGSGFDKISEEYRGKGEAFRPTVVSTSTYFCLTLPDLAHQGGVIEQNELPEIEVPPLIENKNQILALRYCYNKAKTAAEIASFLKMTPSTYFREKLLEPLVEAGYLHMDNGSRPARYIVNRGKVSAK